MDDYSAQGAGIAYAQPSLTNVLATIKTGSSIYELNGVELEAITRTLDAATVSQLEFTPLASYTRQVYISGVPRKIDLTLCSSLDSLALSTEHRPTTENIRFLPYFTNPEDVNIDKIGDVLAKAIGFNPANENELAAFLSANKSTLDELMIMVRAQVRTRNNDTLRELLK